MNHPLHEDETIEDLQLNGLQLIQKKNAFRFGMDSVLLSHFARIKETDTVADLGTGNGILPLLLYGRKKGCRYYAAEIQKDQADLARRNVLLNGLENIISVYYTDAADLFRFIGECKTDAVVCNPPYGQPAAVLSSPVKEKSLARNQEKETLDHLLSGAHHLLKGKGGLFLVYPAPQMLFLMKKLQEFHMEPKRFQLIYPYADKPANLVLIEAVKDAKPTLHPMPPLIIHTSDGHLTNELKSVYHIL